jgi:hypothetical protein
LLGEVASQLMPEEPEQVAAELFKKLRTETLTRQEAWDVMAEVLWVLSGIAYSHQTGMRHLSMRAMYKHHQTHPDVVPNPFTQVHVEL